MVKRLFGSSKPIIGMVHLPPLPDSPGWINGSSLDEVIKLVEQDIESLVSGGVDGLLFENFGDAPFTKTSVSPLTVSSMTKIIDTTTSALKVTFGINVLRNDWRSSLSIAAVTGADFVRINILTGVYATDQGIIEGDAYAALRFRKMLESITGNKISILADVHTKHAEPLYSKSLEESTMDLVQRAGPDAIIVTGERTGQPPKKIELTSVIDHSGDTLVFVGSGVNNKNFKDYLEPANGFIIGTYFKKDGKITNQVDKKRVTELTSMLHMH